NLRLHDNRSADPICDLSRFFVRVRDLDARDSNVVAGQDLLGLVLVYFHACLNQKTLEECKPENLSCWTKIQLNSVENQKEMLMAVRGKHALITGSSRGIGRGIALKLAQQGVRTAIHYFTHEDAANETLAKVRACGGAGFVVQADVSRPEEIQRMFDRVRLEFDTLDILVSNARPELAAFYRPPMDITLEQWRMAVDSQAQAFLLEVQTVARFMPDGGRIIAIS